MLVVRAARATNPLTPKPTQSVRRLAFLETNYNQSLVYAYSAWTHCLKSGDHPLPL
eukprot:COSAG02_NODE_37401_length_442_cov_1.052478_1_plen_55_part_10